MSADLAIAGRPSRPRLPWVLFALSLALNLCFVAGVFWLRTQAAHGQLTPAQRFEAVARQLSLDDNQHAAFERFVGALRMRTRQLRESNEPIVHAAWGELAKPHPDDAALDHLIDEISVSRRAYQLDTSRSLRGFLAVLGDAQRSRFAELMTNRQNRDVPPLLRQLVP